MICERCGATISDDDIYCKECEKKNHLAQVEQREILSKAKQEKTDLVLKECHSPIMLAMTVCFTIATILKIPAIFTGLIGGLILGIVELIQVIFMIITSIGMWSCFFARSDLKLPKNLKRMAAYDSFCIKLISVYRGITIAVGVFVTVFAILAFTDTKRATGGNVTFPIGIILFVTWVIVGSGIAICHFIKMFPERRATFITAMINTIQNNSFKPKEPPKALSCIWGALLMLPAIIAIIFSQTLAGFIGMINPDIFGASPVLSKILSGIFEFLSIVTQTIGTYAIASNIPVLLLGTALILSGIWMGSISEKFDIVILKIDKATNALSELQDENNARIRLINEKKREVAERAQIIKMQIENSNQATSNTASAATAEIIKYSISKDGKASAAIEIDKLREMALTGEIGPETLVWKRGMNTWMRADAVPELMDSFPPPIDSEEPYMPPVSCLQSSNENDSSD